MVILLIGQSEAFWPFDSDSSSTSSGSSSTSSSSSSSSSSSKSSKTSSTSAANGYQPINTTCPSTPRIRKAENISESEASYIVQRSAKTNSALITFLNDRANLTDFDAEKYINSYSSEHNISIGLAFSGGGYRAMLSGAGNILSLDDRYPEAVTNGLGGLLQASTYLVGLSGGSWLVGTLVLNDWISVADIISGNVDIWSLDNSIFNPSGINVFGTVSYYTNMDTAISAKNDSGYPVTVTDIWGRALSNQFIANGNGGENLTWSGIRNMSTFESHDMPYPIIVANGRTPGTVIINENSTVFEMSPYEIGSWDPSLNSFYDMQYLGSTEDQCVTNFDNAGFIMATSSSLFNALILQLGQSELNLLVKKALDAILSRFSDSEVDIALYEPNPFLNYADSGVKAITDNETLFLADGGEDAQNVPFYPLIQTSRDVDIIFAFDNSADTNSSWPNSTSIVHTYTRQFAQQGNGTPFPFVPLIDTFLQQNMREKPVFFGCDAANLTSLIDYHQNENINVTDIPFVVLFASNEYAYEANTSTFKMSYDNDEMYGLIENGFEVATRANLTDDLKWATCVGCAIIRRSQERMNIKQSEECQACFQEYCWRGGAAEAAYVPVGFDVGPPIGGLGSLGSLSRSLSSLALKTQGSSSKKSGIEVFKPNSIMSYLALLMVYIL